MRSVEFGQATTPLTLLANPYQWEFLLGCAVAILAVTSALAGFS
jgi:hypothetical protein